MNGMHIEMQVKKAVLEKSLPKDLLDEIEYRLGIQEVEIERDPEGWGTTELDYTLAFDDTWDFVVWKKDKKYSEMGRMHHCEDCIKKSMQGGRVRSSKTLEGF